MAYLLDTGILLRLVNAQDGQHGLVRQAVRSLVANQESLHITTQNIAEFCNVATRPAANNGYGWSPSTALDALALDVEPICSVLTEPSGVDATLKRLIAKYAVVGKQVHDARLAAMMLAWQVNNILTLNGGDFLRYAPEGISVASPASLTGSP